MNTSIKEPPPEQKLANIKLVIFDVDGVMTSGGISYNSDNQEIKTFNVKDGLGIKLLRKAGIETAIITGRNSVIVERRANELGIEHLIQGRDDKLQASLELSKKLNIGLEQTAYMGDDLPDLSAIQSVGFGITVADAIPIVIEHADYVCNKNGGEGAVREACEYILERQKKLTELTQPYLKQ
jgi:3-deoxy-D-manno-octulosonate 8-phosphate phosphatase (KDO 8-P phosphatase)